MRKLEFEFSLLSKVSSPVSGFNLDVDLSDYFSSLKHKKIFPFFYRRVPRGQFIKLFCQVFKNNDSNLRRFIFYSQLSHIDVEQQKYISRLTLLKKVLFFNKIESLKPDFYHPLSFSEFYLLHCLFSSKDVVTFKGVNFRFYLKYLELYNAFVYNLSRIYLKFYYLNDLKKIIEIKYFKYSYINLDGFYLMVLSALVSYFDRADSWSVKLGEFNFALFLPIVLAVIPLKTISRLHLSKLNKRLVKLTGMSFSDDYLNFFRSDYVEVKFFYNTSLLDCVSTFDRHFYSRFVRAYNVLVNLYNNSIKGVNLFFNQNGGSLISLKNLLYNLKINVRYLNLIVFFVLRRLFSMNTNDYIYLDLGFKSVDLNFFNFFRIFFFKHFPLRFSGLCKIMWARVSDWANLVKTFFFLIIEYIMFFISFTYTNFTNSYQEVGKEILKSRFLYNNFVIIFFFFFCFLFEKYSYLLYVMNLKDILINSIHNLDYEIYHASFDKFHTNLLLNEMCRINFDNEKVRLKNMLYSSIIDFNNLGDDVKNYFNIDFQTWKSEFLQLQIWRELINNMNNSDYVNSYWLIKLESLLSIRYNYLDKIYNRFFYNSSIKFKKFKFWLFYRSLLLLNPQLKFPFSYLLDIFVFWLCYFYKKLIAFLPHYFFKIWINLFFSFFVYASEFDFFFINYNIVEIDYNLYLVNTYCNKILRNFQFSLKEFFIFKWVSKFSYLKNNLFDLMSKFLVYRNLNYYYHSFRMREPLGRTYKYDLEKLRKARRSYRYLKLKNRKRNSGLFTVKLGWFSNNSLFAFGNEMGRFVENFGRLTRGRYKINIFSKNNWYVYL